MGFYSDGKKIWHSDFGGTKVYDLATGSDEECAKGRISYRAGDKMALIRERGGWSAAKFGAKMHGETINTSDAVAFIDYPQEWAQIFDEVWRAFRDGYYVQNMHGRDWKAAHALTLIT